MKPELNTYNYNMSTTQPIIGKEIAGKVIPLIQKAKVSIEIIVYDWRWYPNDPGINIQRFNNEIINAAKRNIIVRVITESNKTCQILDQNGVKAKKLISKKTIHTKLMLIDKEITIIGSHNYTKNAFNLNEEVSIITDDKETINRLKEYFDNLWSL